MMILDAAHRASLLSMLLAKSRSRKSSKTTTESDRQTPALPALVAAPPPSQERNGDRSTAGQGLGQWAARGPAEGTIRPGEGALGWGGGRLSRASRTLCLSPE